ncbi:MAG: hypothetical protein ABI772_00545, partial [Bacteroidota bacterium]
LDFVKIISKATTEKEKKHSFTKLYEELVKLNDDPFEKPVFENFDFLTWAESKVTGKSFAELTAEHVNKKMELNK